MSQGIEEISVIGREEEIKREGNRAHIKRKMGKGDFETDFIVSIIPKQPFSPTATAEKCEKDATVAMMANFYPSYDHYDEDLFEPKSELVKKKTQNSSFSCFKTTLFAFLDFRC